MYSYKQLHRKVIADGRNEGWGDVSELHIAFYVLTEKEKSSVFEAVILATVPWSWEEGILSYLLPSMLPSCHEPHPPVLFPLAAWETPGTLCTPLGALTQVALCSCLCAEFSYSPHQTGSCLRAETVLSQLLKYVVCARQLNRSWITLIQMLNSQLHEELIGIACKFIINCQFSCVLRNGFKSSVNFLMTLIFFIVDNSRK